ncbi:MAG: enolase C-terminal domain-like protein [Pseudomonadota bacterium]
MPPRPSLFERILTYESLQLHTASSGSVEGLQEAYLTLDYDGLIAASELRLNISYLTGVDADAQRRMTRDAVARFPFSSDPEADRQMLEDFNLDPRSRTLLDAALVDAAARIRGISAAALLGGPDGPPCHDTNQTLFRDSPDRVVARARAYMKRGYRSLKLRLGFGDPNADLALMQRLRRALGPDARLSGDVNGAWSLADTQRLLAPLAKLRPDYLEQPIPPGDLDAYVALAEQSPFPIMLDESLCDETTFNRVCDIRTPLLLHLKLVKAGGLDRVIEMSRKARASGHDVMIGQMNEGGLATAAALSLAVALRPRFAELYGADGLTNDPATGLLYSGGQVCSEEPVGIGAHLKVGAQLSCLSEIPL